MFVFLYPKLTLCGVETGKEKDYLENEYRCCKRIYVSIHSRKRCKDVCPSKLQNERKGDGIY